MATLTAAEAGSQNRLHILDLIGWSEGTVESPLTKWDGYNVIVSSCISGAAIFPAIPATGEPDYSNHPFASGRAHQIVRTKPQIETSSASGRYQLEVKWWTPYKALLKLSDFSPRSQDLIALQQIRERKVLPLIDAGQWQEAITGLCKIWASFPGNSYGQGGRSMGQLMDRLQILLAQAEPAQ